MCTCYRIPSRRLPPSRRYSTSQRLPPPRRLTEFRRPHKKQTRTPRFDCNHQEMGFFTSAAPSNNFLAAPPAAPSRKKSQRFTRPRDDVDEFLSSDLELSFASTMSLHSPRHAPIDITPDHEHSDLMDISPPPPANPVFTRAPPKDESSSKPRNRPRAFTSVAREFGRDVSNARTPTLQPPPISISNSGGSASQPKRIQRSALPFEWLTTAPSPQVDADTTQFLFAQVR